MVDQLTLQTIGILLTGLTVSIAAIYYTLTLRYTRRNQDLQLETRQAQLFQQIHGKFHETEFWEQYIDVANREWKDIEDYHERFGGPENVRSGANWAAVGAYYEGIGVMVHRKLVDISMVYDLTHSPIFNYWEKYEAIIRNMRECSGNPEIWKWIEYLYNKLKDYEKLIQQSHN